MMACGVLLTIGCGSDDGMTVTDNSGKALTFTVAADDMTRSVADGTLTADETFRVFATEQQGSGTKSVFIPDDGSNNIVSYGLVIPDAEWNTTYYGLTGWHTAQPYYYAEDKTYHFYAVWPVTAPIITPSADLNTISLTYTTNANADEDLLYAVTANQTQIATSVPLTFHHALAQVTFKGKLSAQFQTFGWTVEVGSITIHNVNTTGTFTYPASSSGTSTGNWTSATTPVLANYTLTPATTGGITVNSTAEAVALTSATDVTMLMPQTLTAWTPASETGGTTIETNDSNDKFCYLSIQLRIKDKDGNYVVGSSATYHTVYAPFSGTWAHNRCYRYTLTFGGGYDAQGNPVIQTIGIEAAITPWNTASYESIVKRKSN